MSEMIFLSPEDSKKNSAQRKHPLAKCEECPLQTRGKYVPSSFPTKESNGLAFIGESPGSQEKRQGKPFVGPSGQLLNAVLERKGINRDGALLTNAALCNYKDEDKDSLPGAIEACRPRLISELEKAGTTTAITLGNSAKAALLNTKVGITKLRGGDPKASDYVSGLLVIPTFHPAAILRAQANMPLFESDIGKVTPKVATWEEPTYYELLDKQSAIRALTRANSKFPYVVDVETGAEKEEGYTRTTNLLCVGLGHIGPSNGNRVVVIGRPAIYDLEVQEELIKLLSTTGIICQNGKFDHYILSLINPWEKDIWLVADTMLMSYSLNENPGTHGLKYMGVEYLGTPAWGDEIKHYLKAHKHSPELVQWARDTITERLPVGLPRTSDDDVFRSDLLKGMSRTEQAVIKAQLKEMQVEEYKGSEGMKYASRIRLHLPESPALLSPADADGSFASIPPPLLHKYNAFDVAVTRQLHGYFKKQQEKHGLLKLNEHLMIMSNALMRVERNGLYIDYSYNTQLYDEFSGYIEKLNVFDFNPGSWQQLQKHMKDVWDVEMSSTDEDHIVALMNHPRCSDALRSFCENLLEYRRWTKLRSTYVTSIRNLALENGGKVLPTFKIDQATTGRLASKNPNVQNIPRKFNVKRQFIPSSPDRVFVHADYSQLELRVLTWLAKDEAMRDLFNDPTRDVFDELTLPVYNMTKEEFEYLKEHDPAEAKEKRVIVKSFAYGIAYGRTPEGIASDPDLNLSIPEARDRHRVFMRQIPVILDFQAKVIRDMHKGKDLVNPFGRRRRFHLITKQNQHDLEKQAMAFLPQSTASDICVTALSRLPKWMDPRNIIHDDILLEAPREEAEYHGQVLSRIMKETAEEFTDGYVSFEADAGIGETWRDLK